MRLRNLVVAACVLAGIAGSSSAATLSSPTITLTVGAQDYEITTISGTFDALGTTLMGQVWWGDYTLAMALATELGTTFGMPNLEFGAYSAPAFAVQEYDDSLFGASNYSIRDTASIGALPYPDQGMTFLSNMGRSNAYDTVWAVAVVETVPAVPLPAGGLLLLSGLAGVAALKRRKERTA
jgi:hypothetical protein